MTFNYDQFIEDRNAALFSLDYIKIKRFYAKYRIQPPEDKDAFWKQVYVAILRIPESPECCVKVAQGWLEKNGGIPCIMRLE